LPAANTCVAGIRSAGDIGAGATAGILLQIFSPLALLLADAVTYVISAFSVRRVSEAEPEPEERLTVRRYASSIVAGFRMLYRSTVLWPVTLAIAHFNLFTAAIQAIYITHALRSGSMSPAEVGVAGALGGVLGLLSMAAAPRIWDRLRPINALALTFALPAVAGIGMLALVPGRTVFNVALLALSLGLWAASVMTNVTGTETHTGAGACVGLFFRGQPHRHLGDRPAGGRSCGGPDSGVSDRRCPRSGQPGDLHLRSMGARLTSRSPFASPGQHFGV
jgi:hypothetical protein